MNESDNTILLSAEKYAFESSKCFLNSSALAVKLEILGSFENFSNTMFDLKSSASLLFTKVELILDKSESAFAYSERFADLSLIVKRDSLKAFLKKKREIFVPIELSIRFISLSDFTNWSIFKDFAFSYSFSQSMFLNKPAKSFLDSDDVFISEIDPYFPRLK